MATSLNALFSRPGEAPRRWDGAIGTELIARGLELSREAPEAWNLRRPDEVRALHARYLEAGAEVLQTNTFGGSRPRLAATGLAGELFAVNLAAVTLAREAGARVVVASLGPTGIEARKESAGAIRDAYAEQVEALAEAHVDGLHFETMYHPVEAVAAIQAARRAAPHLPVIVSFTCALGDLGYHTPLGVTLAQMADAITGAEPDAIGINCSLEARRMLGPLRALRERSDLPILMRPQAGTPAVGCKGDFKGDSPERFARDAVALVKEGADSVGGCCGAGPDHIAALTRALAESR